MCFTISLFANGDLLLEYDFNETSGSVDYDSSGNGYNVTLSSGASWTESGKTDGAVSINGSNGYVTIPKGVLNGVDDVTFTADVFINSSI